MCNIFLKDAVLLSIISAGCGQLVILIAFCKQFFFLLNFNCPINGMQHDDEALSSVIFAYQGL